MPVFDFSNTPEPGVQSECTYTVFYTDNADPSPEHPILVLDNRARNWRHHSHGIFTNPIKRTTFEFQEEEGADQADILSIDARFTSLLKWLGENHILVCLSGENRPEGYAVYRIREMAFGGGTKLSVRTSSPPTAA